MQPTIDCKASKSFLQPNQKSGKIHKSLNCNTVFATEGEMNYSTV